MSDLQMWDLIWGFVAANFFLPIIQQPKWSTSTRAAVAFGFCLVSGLVIAGLNGAYEGVHDFRSGLSSILLLLTATFASYKGFGKPVGWAPWLERATALSPPPPPQP